MMIEECGGSGEERERCCSSCEGGGSVRRRVRGRSVGVVLLFDGQ
jgi:DnaJ-class molecular chaperone